MIQHDIGHRIAAQFEDDANAFAIGFVAQIGDALDLLLADQFRDPLDHVRLVHLEGDLADDQRFAILADLLDLDLRAHDDRAAPERVSRADAAMAEDRAPRREIRPGHDFHELRDRHVGAVDHRDRRIDHLPEIVRRNVRRHADGDAAAAID